MLSVFFQIICSFLISISPLILQSSYWQSPQKDVERLIFTSFVINNQFKIWWENSQRVFQWLLGFTTPFVLVTFILGFLIRKKNIIYPLIWFGVPLVTVLLILNNIMASRWIVFLIPAYVLVTHEVIIAFPRFKYTLLSLCLISSIIFSLFLIFSPLTYYRILSFAPLARGDLGLTGWSSGYGVKKAVDYIKELSLYKQSIVFIDTKSGNPQDGILIYLKNVPNVKVMGIVNYSYLIKYKNNYQELIQTTDFYFVSRGNDLGILKDALVPLKKFKKPLDSEFVGLYKVQMN